MTRKQYVVLQYIDLRLDFGRPPTLQEIADHFGVSRPSIHERLQHLRREGLVQWDRSRQRSLRLTPDARRRLPPTPDDEKIAAVAVAQERAAWVGLLRHYSSYLRECAARSIEHDGSQMDVWPGGRRAIADFLELLIAVRHETPCMGNYWSDCSDQKRVS